MADWWHRDIVEPGKQPLLLCLAVFVVVFLVTRTITRLIRAGRGPFRDVGWGTVHVHHVVPGILLLLAGGLLALAGVRVAFLPEVAGAVFGGGAALVLDEFALVLRLEDVYWSEEGRTSVEAVALTAAVMGMMLVGLSPLGVDNLGDAERTARTAAVLHGTVTLFGVAVAITKGKIRLAIVGMFVPVVAWVAAVRLARPDSLWARRFYRGRPATLLRSIRRAGRQDERWTRLRHALEDWVAGRPDTSRSGKGTSG